MDFYQMRECEKVNWQGKTYAEKPSYMYEWNRIYKSKRYAVTGQIQVEC